MGVGWCGGCNGLKWAITLIKYYVHVHRVPLPRLSVFELVTYLLIRFEFDFASFFPRFCPAQKSPYYQIGIKPNFKIRFPIFSPFKQEVDLSLLCFFNSQ